MELPAVTLPVALSAPAPVWIVSTPPPRTMVSSWSLPVMELVPAPALMVTPLLAAAAVIVSSPAPVTTHPARVFVLGGVDGRQVGKMPRDTRVPDHMLCFDVEGHAWKTVEDRWPDPVVTAPTVQVGGEWWIVSGEIMAGVRTTSVWSWKPEMVR